MTARPIGSGTGPDTGSYEVIHLGEQAAVVVPLADYAEDAAAVEEWRSQESAGRTSYASSEDVRRWLGLKR